MEKSQKALPPQVRAWVEARKRHRLSHAQVQMARELGLNPGKLGKISNHRQEPWKAPLPQFIEYLYFGAANAHRILAKHADTCCTFNDDIQGTAAVVLAAALSAARAAGTPIRDQTVVIRGAGTAGVGIADVLRQAMINDGLSPAEATGRFYALESKGLLTSDYAGTMRDYQVRYARPAAEVASWRRDAQGGIGLVEVVARSRPTMLIGTSTQPGVFTEPIITEMAAHTARPVIMPLSNPTSHAEAKPAT